MSKVSLAGSRIIPAPFVRFDKQYDRNADNESVGSTFTVTLIGWILPQMGSPMSDGTFHNTSGYPADEVLTADEHLAAIIRKQEAIRSLFSTDGQILEVQSDDGSAPMKANVTLSNIEFTDDLWFNKCRYTITLSTPVVYVNGQAVGEDEFSPYISSATESWSIEPTEEAIDENDSRTYRMSHSVSAVGKRFYDDTGSLTMEGWEQAKAYVLTKLGYNSTIAASSDVLMLSGYSGYNHARTESIDKNSGAYTVTENWVLSNDSALEDFTITLTRERQSALQNVSIQGEIRGLEVRDSNMQITASKHYNADVKWGTVSGLLLARAQTYTGLTLNVTPLSTSKAVNPVAGVISYNYEYDNRPSHIVSDTLMENITVTHSHNVDSFAAIFVLGRTNGPVLQTLGTKEAKTVNITIDLVMNFVQSTGDQSLNTLKVYFTSSKPSLLDPYKTQIENIIAANNPLNYGYTTAFVHENTETWNPSIGAYTLQYGFTYE